MRSLAERGGQTKDDSIPRVPRGCCIRMCTYTYLVLRTYLYDGRCFPVRPFRAHESGLSLMGGRVGRHSSRPHQCLTCVLYIRFAVFFLPVDIQHTHPVSVLIRVLCSCTEGERVAAYHSLCHESKDRSPERSSHYGRSG